MLNFTPLKTGFEKYIEKTNPQQQYRTALFWGMIGLASLILGFTSYHIQVIPGEISANIDGVLTKRPWVRELVVVDGRQIYLRGQIEPDSAIEHEIGLISGIPGVLGVANVLEESPKPSAHLKLKMSQGKLEASGQLNGENLETIIGHVESSFPDQPLKDLVIIDDSLGHPLWTEGFDLSLEKLNQLDEFELNGWRDQIEITGTAESRLQRQQIGYSIPASLIGRVKVVNHIRQRVDKNFPAINLVSDWRGSYITGRVPTAELRERLLRAAKDAFGIDSIESDIKVDGSLNAEEQLTRLISLLPELSQVRDLTLQSSDKTFLIWGRVDDPEKLGRFLYARNNLGLEQVVRSEIVIANADKSASLTLFSDQRQVILNGILPTLKTRQQLIEDIKMHLGVHNIMDLTSIEPNIAHSNWLTQWPQLLAIVPKTALGITIDDHALLITGNVDTQDQLEKIDNRLSQLFPDNNRLNWITASNQQ